MGTCGSKADVVNSSVTLNSVQIKPHQRLEDFLESQPYTSTYSLLTDPSVSIDKKSRYLAETHEIYLCKHSSIVTSISIAPDKSCIATSSKDKSVRFWDISRKKQFKELIHHLEINQVVISPNMYQVVTLADNKEVAVWNLSSMRVEKRFNEFEFGIGCIQMGFDWKEVYIGGGYLPQQNTCPIRVLNIVTGEESFMYEGHRAAANQIVFSSNYKNFVSCSGGQYMTVSDNSVRLWEVGNKETVRVYSNFAGFVNATCINNSLRQVYGGCKDGSIHLMNFDMEKVNVFRGHTSGITCLTLSKNEDFLVSGAQDSTVKVWDLGNQWMSYEFKISTVYSIAFLGDYIIAGGVCSIKLLDFNSHNEHGLPGHHGKVEFIKINKNSPYIMTGSVGKTGQDKSIQIWNLHTGAQESVINQVPVFKDIQLNSDGTGVLFVLEDGSFKGYSFRGAKKWVNRSTRFDFYLMAKKGLRVR